jgi:asparagine synthase (glutamine-hydrolysing)
VMVHRALHVTRDDALERQPFVSAFGTVMTWDGRLDNRDDLRLQLRRELRADTTDVALAMAAYETWGDEGFARLVGDWSAVVFDPDRRAVVLASDYMGTRALYYRLTPTSVAWSSCLGLLAQDADVRDALDPRFIVGHLTFAVPPNVTPYRQIESVPPGHAIVVGADGMRQATRFWSLPRSEVRYRSRVTYADALRQHLADAVATHIRSTRPVWAELSGGFDSSTVVCLADRLVRQRSDLETISYVSQSSIESDERPFIRTVEEHIGRSGLHLRLEDCLGAVDAERDWITPRHPRDAGLEILRAVRQRGGRVLLSGSAGDLVMANFPDASESVLGLIARGHALAALGDLRAWSRATQKTIWDLAGRLLVQALPRQRWIDREARALLQSHSGVLNRSTLDAARQFFGLQAAGVGLWHDEISRRLTASAAARFDGRRQLLAGIQQMSEGRNLQSPSEFAGVSICYPYGHRPLVEFMLAVPAEMLYVPGETRALMRAATASILPERIRRRFSKGYAAPFLTRSTKAKLASLPASVDDYYVVQAGFLDGAVLRDRLSALKEGSCRHFGNLGLIVDVERWIRRRQHQASERSAIPA